MKEDWGGTSPDLAVRAKWRRWRFHPYAAQLADPAERQPCPASSVLYAGIAPGFRRSVSDQPPVAGRSSAQSRNPASPSGRRLSPARYSVIRCNRGRSRRKRQQPGRLAAHAYNRGRELLGCCHVSDPIALRFAAFSSDRAGCCHRFWCAAAAAPAGERSSYTIEAGTRVPLGLINSVSTKNSFAGDRIYLETVFPIVIDNHIVIPPGSYVTGTVTEVKWPGRIKGRGDYMFG